ncbi:lipase 1-like [Battus philenor]|uniref:lipase 1-like n=1 Tax=Battus philenor TaxID=42288 RepID=UPI0035D09747
MLQIKHALRQFVVVYIFLLHWNIVNVPSLSIGGYANKYLGLDKDMFLNVTQHSSINRYATEVHTVNTEDGYLLTIFHMLPGKRCAGREIGPPLIMMHGFLMSSDTWLDAGRNASLVYQLSDACVDLWLANARGTHYGRRHLRLDPDLHAEFWDFSSDEVALYDVPATIDYVLKQTGTESVNYLGYSQGANTFMMMCSEKPAYCTKARLLIALAPPSRLVNSKSVGLRVSTSVFRVMENVLASVGVKELFSKGNLLQKALSYTCTHDAFLNNVCKAFRVMFDSDHEGSITPETLKVFFGHFPTGVSVRMFARYGQALYSDVLRKYDFGETENIRRYGSADAPTYNLSAMTTPTVVMHGKMDLMVDVEDLPWLVNSLPNVLENVVMEYPEWNHFDFIYSKHNSKLVVPKILKYLAKYSD